MSDIQYNSLSAPIVTDVPPDPAATYGWQAYFPDRYRAKTIAAACIMAVVAPLFVADVTTPAPVESWRSGTAYPDKIYRTTLPSAAHLVSAQNILPLPPPVSDPGGAVVATGAYLLWQYQELAGPLDVPAPDFVATQWQPTMPAVVRRVARAQSQYFADDTVTQPAPPPAAPDNSWSPIAPAKIDRAIYQTYRAQVFAIDTQWAGPPPAVDFYGWRGQFPDRQYPTKFPRAVYQAIQPHYGVTIQVPVMSWTGQYLTPALRKKSAGHLLGERFVEPIFVQGVTTQAPALSWHGVGPDRNPARPRSLAALLGTGVSPVFIPGVTVVAPELSADAIFPDAVAARAALARALQQIGTVDPQWTAPAAPAVPDLTVAVYPATVPGARRPAEPGRFVEPIFVLDVTVVVTPLSWKAVYPDHVNVAQRQPHLLPAATRNTYPTVVTFKAWFVANTNIVFGSGAGT